MNQKNSQKELNFGLNFRLLLILGIISIISLLGGLIIANQTNIILDQKIAEAKEAERPANLNLFIIQDPTCQDCFNLQPTIEAIKKENIKFNSEKTIEIISEGAQQLITKFNITKAPTLLITGELEKNPALKAWWPKVGEIIEQTFILRQVGAPYVLLATGEVKGRAKLIMLSDQTCQDCYKVTAHQQILRQYGFFLAGQIIDVGSQEGQELIKKYKITLVPTIILTGDLGAYPTLTTIWPQVGTIEKDGTYVFREGVKQMGTYKNLTTNEIVKPPKNSNPNN